MELETIDRLLDELFDTTPVVIDDRELQRGMNRVAREQGVHIDLMNGDRDGEFGQITTLPCQVALDETMNDTYTTQINTYEIKW